MHFNFSQLRRYLMIIGDSVVPTVENHSSFTVDRKIPIVLGTFVILPLCFLSQKTLAFTSSLGVFSNCFIVFAILYNYGILKHSETWTPPEVCMLGFTEGNITFVSSICMAMVIQPCILPMYENLERRSPERFAKSLRRSFLVLWGLFMLFSVFAYITYGAEIKGDVLKNLPKAWYSTVARLAMTVVVITVYPLMLAPLTAPIKKKGQKMVATCVILASTCVGAMQVENLGK